MRRQPFTTEKISDVLYRMVRGQEVSAQETDVLKRWITRSSYNRSVYEDLTCDDKLRSDLIKAYSPAQFWKILLTHRAALHDHFGPHRGNFWQRIARGMTGLLHLPSRSR